MLSAADSRCVCESAAPVPCVRREVQAQKRVPPDLAAEVERGRGGDVRRAVFARPPLVAVLIELDDVPAAVRAVRGDGTHEAVFIAVARYLWRMVRTASLHEVWLGSQQIRVFAGLIAC